MTGNEIMVRTLLGQKIMRSDPKHTHGTPTKYLEVDIREILAPLVMELAKRGALGPIPANDEIDGLGRPWEQSDVDRLLSDLYREPPAVRPRCGWVDQDNEAKCPNAVSSSVLKDGVAISFLCACHAEEFLARPSKAVGTIEKIKRAKLTPPTVPGSSADSARIVDEMHSELDG